MRGTVKKTGTRMDSQIGRSKLSKCCACVYIRACVRARVTYFLPCLLEWMPRLLSFSCLEGRSIYSRAATIRGTRTHTLYCPHAKNMASQGKWTKCSVLTALCSGTMSTRRCGFHFGEILTATQDPKNNYKTHAVCVNILLKKLVWLGCISEGFLCGSHQPKVLIHKSFRQLTAPFISSSTNLVLPGTGPHIISCH